MMDTEAAEKTFPVSWDELHRDTKALAWRLLDKAPFKGIVAITRGGLVPAGIIARELNIRLIETVSIASYEDKTRSGEMNILKSFTPKDKGEGWLVIDDLVDTGETARLVRRMLPEAHFATIYAKPQGKPLVDTYITEVSQDTWIYFPWEFSKPIAETH